MSITVRNLSHIYSKNEAFQSVAVNDISFDIQSGEFVGLIGHTGSGKSTLIQLLCGLIKADSGSIEIDGIDITQNKADIKKIRSKVGIVFQYPEYQLFEETVYRDIAFGPANIGKKPEEIDKIIHQVINDVGLSEDILQKSPFELSGGQKRRVAIAGVLAMEPQILILDEPTAGLDPLARKNLLTLIDCLHKQKNITVILVSHSMEDIAASADRVMVMSHGSLVMFDKAEVVFSKEKELRQIGLDVPQISHVINRLKENGIDVGNNIYTVEAATKAILRYLENKYRK